MYYTVKEISEKWSISERSVRNYCNKGKIQGAILKGKTWMIPKDAIKPSRSNEDKDRNYLLETLRLEKKNLIKGRIYHKLQIDFTYNSNHMEGSKLSHDETRYIFDARLIGVENKTINVDDIVETINHFECFDKVIDFANYELTETFIKGLHKTLKKGTADASRAYFAVGDYKKLANEVGGRETVKPTEVNKHMHKLLNDYNKKSKHTLDEILDFHVKFELIHPFQDGNGRVGRLIMFKECLKSNIIPILIMDDIKLFYYRGLKEWENQKGYLRDTCLTGQDIVRKALDYFNVKY